MFFLPFCDLAVGVLVYAMLTLLHESRAAGLPRWVPTTFVPCFFITFAMALQSTEGGRTVAGAYLMLAAMAGAAPVCVRILGTDDQDR